jgi:hypothetical protein
MLLPVVSIELRGVGPTQLPAPYGSALRLLSPLSLSAREVLDMLRGM